MSEQLAWLQQSSDLAESLFNGLREQARKLDSAFGIAKTAITYNVSTLEAVGEERLYQFSALAGMPAAGRMGLGLEGMQFELSDLSRVDLPPGKALGYVRNNVSNGERLSRSLSQEVPTAIRTADQAVLFIFWRYAVNTFSLDVMHQNEIRLDITEGGQTYAAIQAAAATERAPGGIIHVPWRNRRDRIDQAAVRRGHIVTHIEHILRKLGWAEMDAA